jgi:hypothetical protein
MAVGGLALSGQGSILGGGMQSYDGPSILGRTGPAAGVRGNQAVPMHFQASVEGTYDSALLGFGLDSNGQFQSAGSAGVMANLNVGGRKLWRRSFVGMEYTANYGHYTRQSFFNGTNHSMNLAAGTQLGRKWQLFTELMGGTSNRFLGNSPFFRASEFEVQAAPTQELFDSRMFFLGNQTSAVYNINRRQSFRMSGNASTVRRRARGLVDMKSYGASADWVRRVSRRTSIGASYAFNHFDFEKIFGESDIHTLGVHLSRSIGRDWELRLGVTGAKQSTVGVRTVALDPVLAAILGRTSGTEVFESNNLIYGYEGRVTRQIGRSSLSMHAMRGINPGNGFFLTSVNQMAGVTFNRNVTRNFGMTGSAGYSRMTSLGFASGAFSGWTAGIAVNRKITEDLGLVGRYDWRTFDLAQTNFGRTGYRVTIGLSYHPKDGPAGLF